MSTRITDGTGENLFGNCQSILIPAQDPEVFVLRLPINNF